MTLEMSAPNPARRDVIISKALSYLLRHGALKEKLSINELGYVKINDLLSHPRLKSSQVTRQDIERIVANNDKKRFTISNDNQFICANQGHSIPQINNDNLIPLNFEDLKNFEIYHGTFKNKLSIIKQSGGLSRMNRNHIHFTCKEYNTISGIKKHSNVLVYIDIGKCMEHGIKFYKSLNKVILTCGNEDGMIPWEFITKVVETNGHEINMDEI
ncbi:TPT1 [[Candida] subhashii]|uniref:TPT1 n=1 Tax=[Candida] subhashii TaxID=561895 RepID=A0A8J5QNM0_9ASCO|nr:TPT1 [[Candida] subhashii]KAG7663690.1 TPT1 [[Candida] subhashii]